MATTIPTNPTSQTVSGLLQKITDPDPDYRFMALSDLHTALTVGKSDILYHDYNTAARTIDHVVKALDDQNGEVQNQAIKSIGPLVKKLPFQAINPMMERLAALRLKNSVDTSVPVMAMRAAVEALPRPERGVQPSRNVTEAYSSIQRVLIPRFLGTPAASAKTMPALLGADLSPDSVDVLIEVVRCFGIMLTPFEVEALHAPLVQLLEQDKGTSAVKKRAVIAVSMLSHYLDESLLRKFLARTREMLGQGRTQLPTVTRRLYITMLGSMARSIPYRFGRYLPDLVPFVLKALSEEDLEADEETIRDGGDAGLELLEVREAALVALEAFLSACPTRMRPFTDEAIAASLRFIKFDPNYVQEDDEAMEEVDEDGDGLEDDEFEADMGFDDDDDASWKVRRCAAKTLHTIISTRSSGDLLDSGVLYSKVAPALVRRFDEREENVRLEVLAAMSLLVRKTGEGLIPDFSVDSGIVMSQLPPNRKRRRESSGVSASFARGQADPSGTGTGLASPATEKAPASGSRADLAELTPAIVKSAIKLLKGKLIPTKQATVNLLDGIIAVQRGGLATHFDLVLQPVLDAVKPTSAASTSASLASAGGSGSATATTLRITSLRLLSDIAKNHTSVSLQPYLPRIVAVVVASIHDKFYKISGEAIQTAEEVAKVITPPRSQATTAKFQDELVKLYDVILERAVANDADTEVREKAIYAMGTLLARTAGSKGATLLPSAKRTPALDSLVERLKNETTRLAAVRAINTIAASASADVQFDPQWVRTVASELASQLRKSNRALRGSSIVTLKHLVLSPATTKALDGATMQNISTALITVIKNNDNQLLGPSLVVLAHVARQDPHLVATPDFVNAFCRLLQSPLAGSVLDSALVLVAILGEVGQGAPVMQGLLQKVGVGGDPTVVGKVIGTLLVASGDSAGVTMESFQKEVVMYKHDQGRASLGLTVLGEAGLRLGRQFSLRPDFFLDQFTQDYDQVSLAAATALGRAGSGNVAEYLPIILEHMRDKGRKQYLLLQSTKEILQQVARGGADINAYSDLIWDAVLGAAGDAADDNKAVCAECVGRLVIINPQTYMKKLDTLLRDTSQVLRAIAVQALRYTLPDENDKFDALLKGYLVDMLKTMLEDPEMEIRRHALTTLNSAAHNKPELTSGHLGQLMPYVMAEAKIKPELIREVQMGPFKHIIDDGLEVRKAAYETLYALLDMAFPRIDSIDLYDRLIEGLRDDNDVRALCNLMLVKLAYMDPEETMRRLDTIAEAFRATLSTKLKESAVKQELEKQEEANKSVLRVTALLNERLKNTLGSPGADAMGPPGSTNQAWSSYLAWVHKDFDAQLKVLQEESKQSSSMYAAA